MKKLILATALVALASAAHAAPPSDESIEELFRLTRVEAMLEPMYGNVEQSFRAAMQQALAAKPLTAKQKAVAEKIPERMIALLRAEIPWSTLKPQYAQLYRETFEQEDIDGMLAFYRSSAGQASIAKMPTVMQKSMTLGQSQFQAIMPKLQAATRQWLDEVQNAR